jgi:transaldolase
MLKTRPRTKILVDGGDPEETQRIKGLLGFVDGQTTNPSLVAKNPDIQKRIRSGAKLRPDEEAESYKALVREISPLVGDSGVSIEVFSDLDTKAEPMVAEGRDKFGWIPNAYIKYPSTHEGLKAAHTSIGLGMRVNMTLCFSQEQAAAVYAATKGSAAPVYVSPFIGRLDDIGENGVDLVRNIKRMYQAGDGHVHVLAASIRSIEHLLACFALDAELVTVPAKLLEEWASKGFPMPDAKFAYEGIDKQGRPLRAIPYRTLDLNSAWETFNISHELTTAGIKKFVADYESTVSEPPKGSH